MNVFFYIQSMIAGGAQRVVATLANHWAEQGWDITIVTLTEVSTDFYVLDHRVSRLCLDVRNGAAEAGILANVRRIRRLRALLKQRRPDIAVAMMETASVVLALAGIGTNTVCIGSERIHPPFSEIPPHWHVARDIGYGLLRAVVAQTNATAAWLKRRTRARDVRVIPNPIALPLDRHDPILVPPAAGGWGKYLLAVGRLVPQKNYEVLIDAFARAAVDCPEWKLVILGEGVERDALTARIAKHQLDARILLPGKAGNVGDWYSRVDLFAMTSRYEGFPNTLLEALAHGVPAVAFDCDAGPRDLVRNEVDGLLVPVDDIDGFASALIRLMSDNELRARYACRASEALPRFSVSRIADTWTELFAELCSDTRDTRSVRG